MVENEPEYIPLAKRSLVEINALWPNLTTQNYQLKSAPVKEYNCVAYANGIEYTRIDFYRNSQTGEINEDQSCQPYIEYFKEHGFEECDTPDFEDGLDKIALYEDRFGDFTHVALQYEGNKWTSKLGFLEDIVHSDLKSLEGKKFDQYGVATFFMKRKKM